MTIPKTAKGRNPKSQRSETAPLTVVKNNTREFKMDFYHVTNRLLDTYAYRDKLPEGPTQDPVKTIAAKNFFIHYGATTKFDTKELKQFDTDKSWIETHFWGNLKIFANAKLQSIRTFHAAFEAIYINNQSVDIPGFPQGEGQLAALVDCITLLFPFKTKLFPMDIRKATSAYAAYAAEYDKTLQAKALEIFSAVSGLENPTFEIMEGWIADQHKVYLLFRNEFRWQDYMSWMFLSQEEQQRSILQTLQACLRKLHSSIAALQSSVDSKEITSWRGLKPAVEQYRDAVITKNFMGWKINLMKQIFGDLILKKIGTSLSEDAHAVGNILAVLSLSVLAATTMGAGLVVLPVVLDVSIAMVDASMAILTFRDAENAASINYASLINDSYRMAPDYGDPMVNAGFAAVGLFTSAIFPNGTTWKRWLQEVKGAPEHALHTPGVQKKLSELADTRPTKIVPKRRLDSGAMRNAASDEFTRLITKDEMIRDINALMEELKPYGGMEQFADAYRESKKNLAQLKSQKATAAAIAKAQKEFDDLEKFRDRLSKQIIPRIWERISALRRGKTLNVNAAAPGTDSWSKNLFRAGGSLDQNRAVTILDTIDDNDLAHKVKNAIGSKFREFDEEKILEITSQTLMPERTGFRVAEEWLDPSLDLTVPIAVFGAQPKNAAFLEDKIHEFLTKKLTESAKRRIKQAEAYERSIYTPLQKSQNPLKDYATPVGLKPGMNDAQISAWVAKQLPLVRKRFTIEYFDLPAIERILLSESVKSLMLKGARAATATHRLTEEDRSTQSTITPSHRSL